MNKKDIDILMSYLYGELDNEQKLAFEARLAQDAAFQAELKELQAGRELLQSAQEEEDLKIPPLILNASPPRVKQSKNWLNSRWIQMAAAIALLLFAGRMSGLQVIQADEQLIISFSGAKKVTEPTKDDDFQQLILEQQLDLEATFCSLESSIQQLQEAKKQPLVSKLDDQQIAKLRKSLLAETSQTFEQFFASVEQKQSEQMLDWLSQYSFLVQEQREQDLEAIEYALNELIEQAQYQQVETDLLRNEIVDRLDGR